MRTYEIVTEVPSHRGLGDIVGADLANAFIDLELMLVIFGLSRFASWRFNFEQFNWIIKCDSPQCI